MVRGESVRLEADAQTLARVADRLRKAGCVFAEDEARILVSSAVDDAELEAMAARRASGIPLEHVVGWAAFCGLRIAVDPGVFVPRPRTEFLARQAIAVTPPHAVVVDLCCGAGAVGAAVASATGAAEVYAVDIDPKAAACARKNLGPAARVYVGDLYAPLPPCLRGRVDVLVCNAPYVPSDSLSLMPREARLYEPRIALDGGADGLDVQRRVAAAAALWLSPGASLVFETSERQAPGSERILKDAGLDARIVRDEDRDATVAIGTRTGHDRAIRPASQPGATDA